jgi:citrate synthase
MAKTVRHEDLNSYFGDEDHLVVSQKSSFAQLVFELLSERVPSEKELKIFELILNLSIDHGAETPSASATIQSAMAGRTLSESVAAGILQINESHGGAIEPAMRLYYQVQKGETSAKDLVAKFLAEDKRISGLGHRIYKDTDPRTTLIFEKMKELGLGDEFIKIAQDVESEMESQKGKKLPLNIDAAIAVVLCTLGWDPKLSNAVFIVARTPGLCGQFLNIQ